MRFWVSGARGKFGRILSPESKVRKNEPCSALGYGVNMQLVMQGVHREESRSAAMFGHATGTEFMFVYLQTSPLAGTQKRPPPSRLHAAARASTTTS